MEIIGRVTKDATVTTTKDERKVVNFSIVMNDYFKPKGNFERVIITNYFQCAYWMKPEIAQHLRKGKLVELSGRIDVNAYRNQQGEARTNLTFHVMVCGRFSDFPDFRISSHPIIFEQRFVDSENTMSHQDYSYGDSSGFSPDSLLILIAFF